MKEQLEKLLVVKPEDAEDVIFFRQHRISQKWEPVHFPLGKKYFQKYPDRWEMDKKEPEFVFFMWGQQEQLFLGVVVKRGNETYDHYLMMRRLTIERQELEKLFKEQSLSYKDKQENIRPEEIERYSVMWNLSWGRARSRYLTMEILMAIEENFLVGDIP